MSTATLQQWRYPFQPVAPERISLQGAREGMRADRNFSLQNLSAYSERSNLGTAVAQG